MSKSTTAQRIATLENALKETLWMARRYADGRATYAASSYNSVVRQLLELGVSLPKTDGTLWARDGMGRRYDGLTDAEAEEGAKPPDWREVLNTQIQLRLQERVWELEGALDRVDWRDVGPINNDMCRECEATIDAETQELADGSGWDYIVHKADCPIAVLKGVKSEKTI